MLVSYKMKRIFSQVMPVDDLVLSLIKIAIGDFTETEDVHVFLIRNLVPGLAVKFSLFLSTFQFLKVLKSALSQCKTSAMKGTRNTFSFVAPIRRSRNLFNPWRKKRASDIVI